MTISEAKNKLVSIARAEVGYHEGGNNYTKYADDPNIAKLYGRVPQNQPWCGTFVNWCFMTAFGYDIGSKLTFGGSALCRTAADNYKAHNAFTKFPEVGDQAFYYSGGAINHTGIVVAVDGTLFTAVEGNYSDKVSLVTHNIGKGDVAGFGKPCWESAVQVKEPSNSGGSQPKEDDSASYQQVNHEWKPQTLFTSNAYKDDCVVLQALLNAHSFPCGSADGFFGPKTQAAVNAAQQHYKLEVDGVCGPKTWAKLLEVKTG